jgi:hypothetical protein
MSETYSYLLESNGKQSIIQPENETFSLKELQKLIGSRITQLDFVVEEDSKGYMEEYSIIISEDGYYNEKLRKNESLEKYEISNTIYGNILLLNNKHKNN